LQDPVLAERKEPLEEVLPDGKPQDEFLPGETGAVEESGQPLGQ